MSTSDERSHEAWSGWEEIGRAAEDFARRVARDATRFAERMQEHSSEFAHDVGRDWRRFRRGHERRRGQEHTCGRASADDVRRVFDDVRGVVAGVLDGIDELIDRVFPPPANADPAEWHKVVSNRDVTCAACSQPIAVGDEAYLRRAAAGAEYRCVNCGATSSNVS